MGKTDKLDLYKQHKAEYAAKKTPALVTVKAAAYLTIAGRGEPGGEAFTDSMGGLYGAAYTIKFASKFAGKDYKVCPPEGLWWCGRKRDFFTEPRDKWSWKLLIRTPDFITAADLAKACETLLAKGETPAVRNVRLETFEEGLCVQMLHVGPYTAEAATIEIMMQFVHNQKLKCHGKHHEIYLSDPRRVAPERLRTVLRYPVR